MSVRTDVLRFLQEPKAFFDDVSDGDVWLAGLNEFAIPSIEEKGDRHLREAQVSAWEGLAHRRTGLILGPPGTGKTFLLSWLIAGYCAARRKAGLPARVLVTAFTRNAIGNVLDAVRDRQVLHDPSAPPPLFLGSPPAGGLADGVLTYGAKEQGKVIDHLNGGEAVTGMTVWSLYRLLTTGTPPGGDGMSAPLFDLVCIDEASQMVLGHGLLAMAGLADAGRVVVAGDDQQLPPIRAGRPVTIEGRELGGSLYAFMKSVGADEFALEETFRLNKPLTYFPEKTFYPGKYVSRSEASKLELREDWQADLSQTIRLALAPDYPLVVLLHDGPTAATANPFETQIACEIAAALAHRLTPDGTPPSDLWSKRLAIVSPHRAQNAAIRAGLPGSIRADAFVETVDRIQGKERDAVILSYCVADPEFALTEAEFIFSPERLNVAATRAGKKLIVIVSKRLLEAVPSDQELLDKAELLREFVFSCPSIVTSQIQGPAGRSVAIDIRARGFDDNEADVDLTPDPPPVEVKHEMTDLARGVLEVINRLALDSAYGNAALSKVKSAMALPAEPFAEACLLHHLGWISLRQQPRRDAGEPFWVAKPFKEARKVFGVDYDTVKSRIEMCVREAKTRRYAFYADVRDRFAWMDKERNDLLAPVISRLEEEDFLRLEPVGNSFAIIVKALAELDSLPEPEELEGLGDEDFAALNRLEELEAGRINFGVYDSWVSTVELARDLKVPLDQLTASLSKLEAHGHLLLADEGRVRSRFAEIGRELKHVKQRFRSDDADTRPYLVRSLKAVLRERNKPTRSIRLASAFDQASKGTDSSMGHALSGMARVLHEFWGEEAALAKFQADSLTSIVAAWRGEGEDAFSIAADTGSGKTEAAVLPLIAGALADGIDGVMGTRAILAYPRIRLAANQAQRLAHYLSMFGADQELPKLTLGLQVGEVPWDFERIPERLQSLWKVAGPNAFVFPFFACPSCQHELILRPGAGAKGADLLACNDCKWSFDGWIGSKTRLAETPPSLFLPTTDSLHQWLHDPRYGRIFGDDMDCAAPRALLADEIHLYTHIHGAQVGLALQRLAARAQTSRTDGKPMLAIGMSATVGDPALAWSKLIGRDQIKVIQPSEEDAEPNPRGREYFYFVQPEVESRGADIAGASTTIQSLMCIGHGMRRRTGSDGGFRSLVFFDSIDKMRRLHSAFIDAEEGRELAAYRTRAYGDDAAGEPQTECCGQPLGCGRFADGECWWFAATDNRQVGAKGRRTPGQPLAVASSPIFSGTGGNAERLVKGSDVVFATSSLEVGYDDPDITLVYQHYAPLNLASFVQRKGRGGRGADDRPTTAVTLSIYSPRDNWWFNRPQDMVSPVGFEAPLNPSNAYVRRGQAVATLLDGLARFERRGGKAIDQFGQPNSDAIASAKDLLDAMFGGAIWDELGVKDAEELWAKASDGIDLTACDTIPKIRMALSWVPGALFETINLPILDISGEDVVGGDRQDISLALSTVAPGNATRRYSGHTVHWISPSEGRAPWFGDSDYLGRGGQSLRASTEDLLAELPIDAREALADVHETLFKPTTITVNRLGRMQGSEWVGEICLKQNSPTHWGKITKDEAAVRHDSRGELAGFVLVSANSEPAEKLSVKDTNGKLRQVSVYLAGVTENKTSGLEIARVYWGGDAEVRFDSKEVEPAAFTQTFVHPKTQRALLHGYKVITDGIRFQLEKEAIDLTVKEALEKMEKDRQERRWRSAQFTRYLVDSRARSIGFNAYEARRGADLLVAAAGEPELRAELTKLVRRRWDDKRFSSLLEDARHRVLSCHPMMTQRRVERTANLLANARFRDMLDQILTEVGDEQSMRGFLRSSLLHGLALRLKSAVAMLGGGDESRMFAHVRLPLQFGKDAEDLITVAEAGSYGDGTIRSAVSQPDKLMQIWLSHQLCECGNAVEDAMLRVFWSLRSKHDQWRSFNPRDPSALTAISQELRPGTDRPLPASISRVLFGTENVGAETFSLYDIAEDVEQSRDRTIERMGRIPTDWELASAAVNDAESGASSELARLLEAYGLLEEPNEGSFSPPARLAEQVFRLGASLCHDGCRACVHQSSDLMGDSLVYASTSRTLLERFLV